jgi:spermidine synthase
MTESGSAHGAVAPAGSALVRGGLVVPTLLFALYLTHAAAAAILGAGAFRVYSLTAGFTSGAACSAISVLAIAGALGAALAGLRSRHAPAPMALLVLTEAGFGLSALASVVIFRITRAVYLVLWPVVGHSAVGGFGLRLLLAAGMFALPAALYCASIPILSRLISARPGGVGLSLGFSFGLSLAGSALGLAAAGTLVLPALGVRGSVLMGLALAGFAVAGCVLLRQRGLEGPGVIGASLSGLDIAEEGPHLAERPAGTTSTRAGALGAAMSLFAFTAWGFLLLWDRTLSFIVGRTLEARATTGAVFLLVLAAGVFLSSALADRLKGPFAALAALAGAASIGAYASMYLVPQVALFYLRLTPWLSRPGLTHLPAVLASLALMMPSALFLGAALPLLGQGARILRRPAPGVVIFFALGIVLADLVIGLLSIPAFGLRRSLSLVSAVGLLASILFVAFVQFKNPTLRPTLALILLGLMIILGAFPASWDPRIIDAGLYRYGARSIERFGSVQEYLEARQGIDLLFYHEGKESSVMVERTLRPSGSMPPEEVLTLTVDGKVEATTGNDIRTQVLQGHIPVLVHGPTETVLQIDFLDGITSGSVLKHPVKSLTVIEREAALFDASKNFASYNDSPIDDQRLQRVVDGARARLLADPARYDVIIVAGFEPWLPQSASLVTTEGLTLLKERLNSGGLVSLRLPLASTGEAELRAVMRSFARVFPSVLLFRISDEDLLLLGSPEPLSLDAGWFRNVISSTGDVARDLHRVTVLGPNEIFYTFRLAGDGLRKVLSNGPESDDDRATVEFASARDMTVHSNTALVAGLQEDWGSVLPHLKNYGATPEEKADFLYNLAKSYLGIAGDPVRSRDIARELAALGQSVKARWVMGEALMQQADVDGALGEWRGVLEADPGNLDALFSLGTYFMDSRDYWKAEPYLEKAAKVFGDVSIVRYNHGRNLFYLGNDKEAMSELKEARRINIEKEKRDGYPLVDYLVGVVSHRLKNDKAAADSLETYLKWAYTQPLTRVEVDAHLKLAEAYDGMGKRFDAHKQRQKGEDLLRRLQGQASAAPPSTSSPPQ